MFPILQEPGVRSYIKSEKPRTTYTGCTGKFNNPCNDEATKSTDEEHCISTTNNLYFMFPILQEPGVRSYIKSEKPRTTLYVVYRKI